MLSMELFSVDLIKIFFFKVDGEFRCIGATTPNEYKTYIEKNPVLEKCFRNILVEEISVDDCISILYREKNQYESYYNGRIYLYYFFFLHLFNLVQILDLTLLTAAKLSHRYMTNGFLPNKALCKDFLEILTTKYLILRFYRFN
jgi:ATP-dependent Clp protease ATP-binding subunit ClpB